MKKRRPTGTEISVFWRGLGVLRLASHGTTYYTPGTGMSPFKSVVTIVIVIMNIFLFTLSTSSLSMIEERG